MKIKISVLLLSFLFIFSCEKDQLFPSAISDQIVELRSNVPEVLPILDLLKEPVDGYVSFSHSGHPQVGGGIQGDDINCGGFISGKEDQVNKNFGLLSIANKAIECKPENYYSQLFFTGASDLFGSNIPVALAGTNEKPPMSSVIYAPELLEVTSFPDFDGWHPIEMTVGSEITWNADANNENGVGILLRYDPLGEYNGRHGGIEGTNHSYYFVTEDDGSYTFTEEDLAGFPADHRIEVDMARGNYKRVATADNQYHIGVICYSLNSFSFQNR